MHRTLSLLVLLVLAGPASAGLTPVLSAGMMPSQVGSEPEVNGQADPGTSPTPDQASLPETELAGPELAEGREATSPLARAVARLDSLEAALRPASNPDEVQQSLDTLRETLAEAADAEESAAGDLQQAQRDAASRGTPVRLGWEVLLGGLLLALLGAGAGWVAASRRSPKEEPLGTRDKSYLQDPGDDQDHPDREADSSAVHRVESTLQALEWTLLGRLDRIEQALAGRESRTRDRAPDSLAAPTPRAPSVPPPRGDQGHARAIGEAFVAWCRGAGPRVSEREAFADQLATALPGATVRAVFRDRDSARLPVVFTEDGGRSPAEYWIVEGAGGPWLLPFPQGPRQFRDLADGTFSGGRIAPQSLQEAVPATLQSADGGGFSVAGRGHLA